MFWSICLVFCPTRKSLDWELWVSGSGRLNKNMIDAGVGAEGWGGRTRRREKYKQKINKTERWAGLGWAGDTRHTGHNSVLRQECVRGILTITNVGLTAHSRQIVSPALWFTFCPREHHGTRGLVTLHYRRYVDYVKIWRRGQSFMKSLNQQSTTSFKFVGARQTWMKKIRGFPFSTPQFSLEKAWNT